jgi:5-methylthioribose kinase
MLGRHLAVNRRQMHSIEEINAVAERIEKVSHSSVASRRS